MIWMSKQSAQNQPDQFKPLPEGTHAAPGDLYGD